MKIYDLAAHLEQMPVASVSPHVTKEEAINCMRVLGTFNGCTLGLVHFSGQTAWERHAGGDEILHILEGETELTQLTRDGPVTSLARKGDVVQIPAGVWHSQRTRSPVKLLFLTVAEGTEGSASMPAV